MATKVLEAGRAIAHQPPPPLSKWIRESIGAGRHRQARVMIPPGPTNSFILTIGATKIGFEPLPPWNLKNGWEPSPGKFLPTPLRESRLYMILWGGFLINQKKKKYIRNSLVLSVYSGNKILRHFGQFSVFAVIEKQSDVGTYIISTFFAIKNDSLTEVVL